MSESVEFTADTDQPLVVTPHFHGILHMGLETGACGHGKGVLLLGEGIDAFQSYKFEAF